MTASRAPATAPLWVVERMRDSVQLQARCARVSCRAWAMKDSRPRILRVCREMAAEAQKTKGQQYMAEADKVGGPPQWRPTGARAPARCGDARVDLLSPRTAGPEEVQLLQLGAEV
jgi:hypothetical protein